MTTSSLSAGSAGLRGVHRGWLLGVLLVGPFMSQADATIVNVATPSIHADLGASGAMLELIVGGYLIAFAALLITGARLGEALGYRRVYLAAVTAFGLASLACGLAVGPVMLVIARVAQGASAALMFPQALTGIQLNFDGEDRVRAIGLYAASLSAGAVIGQTLGGVLVSAGIGGSHWRPIFLINVPVAAVTVTAGLLRMPPDERRVARGIDLPGVATLTAGLLLVVLPLVLGRPEGWPAWTWACLAACAPAFALFLLVQRRVAAQGGAPLVNVAILARPPVGWALLSSLAATGTYFALLFTLAQYLQQGLRYSALTSGLILVPWVAAFGLAGQIVRRVPGRRVARAPAAGCLLLTVGYAAISVMLFCGLRNVGLLAVLLAVGGLGLGINFSALLAHLSTAVPPGYAPDISGVSSTASIIGGTLGVAAFGTLYFGLVPAGTAGGTRAFAIVTAAFTATALVAVLGSWRATVTRQEPAAPRARATAGLPIAHGKIG